MKGIVTKVSALLLIVWYSMSIIGFGIHTCSGSERSFVVTFVEGFSCKDIHPDHRCAEGQCCSHSHCNSCTDDRTCLKSMSCCSNDYQVLTLTGTISDERNAFEVLSSTPFNNYFEYCRSDNDCPIYSQSGSHSYDYQSGGTYTRKRQTVLRVWRI